MRHTTREYTATDHVGEEEILRRNGETTNARTAYRKRLRIYVLRLHSVEERLNTGPISQENLQRTVKKVILF